MPVVKHKREEVHCAPSLQCVVTTKLPTSPKATTFAACKLNCYVRGWKGMSALLRGLTFQISSRTISTDNPSLSRPLVRSREHYSKISAPESSVVAPGISPRTPRTSSCRARRIRRAPPIRHETIEHRGEIPASLVLSP